MSENLSELLDSIRERTGDKDAEIARNLGVTPQAVSDWRTGRSKGLRPGTRELLRERYGVLDSYLRTRRGAMFANEEREGAQPPAYDDSALVALIAELARENRRLLGEREYWRGVAAGTGSRDLGRKMFDEAVDRGLSKAGQSKELDEPGSG